MALYIAVEPATVPIMRSKERRLIAPDLRAPDLAPPDCWLIDSPQDSCSSIFSLILYGFDDSGNDILFAKCRRQVYVKCGCGVRHDGRRDTVGDRKSTRLNS